MPKKISKNLSTDNTVKNGVWKNSAQSDPKLQEKESLGDDDFDTPLCEDDLNFDHFDDDEDF